MMCPRCYGKGIVRERKLTPLKPEYTLGYPIYYDDWHAACPMCAGIGIIHCCEGDYKGEPDHGRSGTKVESY
jgi:hypothetical protein